MVKLEYRFAVESCATGKPQTYIMSIHAASQGRVSMTLPMGGSVA